jgi:hypothetical protein
MLKQDLIIACMLAARPDATREEADGFAGQVWKDHFSHMDFMSWNTDVPEREAKGLIAEARRRQVFEVKDLLLHLSH